MFRLSQFKGFRNDPALYLSSIPQCKGNAIMPFFVLLPLEKIFSFTRFVRDPLMSGSVFCTENK
jgi:hypothetical protein